MVLHRVFLASILCLLIVGCATAVSSLEKRGTVYRIELPTRASVIEFPADGFRVNLADDARPYYFLSNDKTRLNVSFNFETATKCVSSQDCRDYLLEKLRTVSFKKDWSTSKVGQVYISEHRDGPINGMYLRQHHLNAHYVVDGVWIDVHLSKANYKDSDQRIFLDFLHSIRIKRKL